MTDKNPNAAMMASINEAYSLILSEMEEFDDDMYGAWSEDIAVESLYDFTITDGKTYREMTVPLIRDHQQKYRDGTYGPGLEFVLAGWEAVAKGAAENYMAEVRHGKGTLTRFFPESVIKKVAPMLRDYYMDELENPEYTY